MLIHSMLPRSAVNGPGERGVVWLQGCALHCPGCWNSSTHRFDSARARPVFSGEDNATLCGASELQNGRWKGPAGKESADESDENFAATQCLLSSPF